MCGGGAGIHVVITAREHFFVFHESPSISTSILFSIFLRCDYLYVFERACVSIAGSLHTAGSTSPRTVSILRFLLNSNSRLLSLIRTLSLSYNSRLFVFAVCPAVCLDCIFMATAQIHRHQTLEANQLRGAHTAIYLYLFYLFSFTLQL